MSYCEEYEQEVMQEILEEMHEDAENYQRSDEDGWFYPDDDGE